MAWDGYRLPSFINEVVWIPGPVNPYDLTGLDLNDFPLVMGQVYWGLKRGFRWPYATIPPIANTFPMMIKLPPTVTASSGVGPLGIGPDWFLWSYQTRVFSGICYQASMVALGQPNQYMGAIVSQEEVPWVLFGMTLPPGWPLA